MYSHNIVIFLIFYANNCFNILFFLLSDQPPLKENSGSYQPLQNLVQVKGIEWLAIQTSK